MYVDVCRCVCVDVCVDVCRCMFTYKSPSLSLLIPGTRATVITYPDDATAQGVEGRSQSSVCLLTSLAETRLGRDRESRDRGREEGKAVLVNQVTCCGDVLPPRSLTLLQTRDLDSTCDFTIYIDKQDRR